jgi:hypothetical protein
VALERNFKLPGLVVFKAGPAPILITNIILLALSTNRLVFSKISFVTNFSVPEKQEHQN